MPQRCNMVFLLRHTVAGKIKASISASTHGCAESIYFQVDAQIDWRIAEPMAGTLRQASQLKR